MSKNKEIPVEVAEQAAGYDGVLADLKELIAESRQRAAASVNRELILLYWQIGAVIVRQQEQAQWGDAVVERLAADLRTEFPEMKGFGRDNIFRMRQLAVSLVEVDQWLADPQPVAAKAVTTAKEKVGTVCQLFPGTKETGDSSDPNEFVGTVSRQLSHTKISLKNALSRQLTSLVLAISWSHHRLIVARCDSPAERYFYIKMSAAERWSVRELRRQIDSVLFTRYTTVKHDPERCLPDDAESGDLLPFRDHYVLEFLGLEEEHTERELRHAILSNLRDFFLEFGRDLTFVGEEYPLTVGNDTFSIDLLFFHRRLQCLIEVDLKKGEFKPEYVGKSQFYCAALDEQIKLPHEKPTIGLVLCKSADSVQVRLALTEAAHRIGVATYQTALPDAELIERRLQQLRLEHFPDEADADEEEAS